MLSQLIVDLEVVRSLVSQNGKKIGEIETDIKNKSEANQNEHQLIEGLNSNLIQTVFNFLQKIIGYDS